MIVCGIDEVGRGALAGPLIAVAASFATSNLDFGPLSNYLLTSNSPIIGIKDSKKISKKIRQDLFWKIKNFPQLIQIGTGISTVEEINDFGIDVANKIAFTRAVLDLQNLPNLILVDGDHLVPNIGKTAQSYRPKGDDYWWPVSAASIIAKVMRDYHLELLGNIYPMYGWDLNAGYGTKIHIEAIKKFGITEFHRTQFTSKFRTTDE